MRTDGACLAIVALLGGSPLALAQSDFEEYVAELKASGMSEDARGSLHMAAGILAGSTLFKVSPAPDGSLGRSYSSAACFMPTSDPKQAEKQKALRDQINARLESWIAFLKPYADADGSGFVSTAEASAVRRRVELGFLSVQVEETSVDDLAAALHADRDELLKDLLAYDKLRAAAVAAGLDEIPPPVPGYFLSGDA